VVALRGAREVCAEPGGVRFVGDRAAVWEANLRLRTASRVLVRVASFRARTFFELERHAGRIGWGDWLAPGVVPVFEVTSRKSKLYHQRGIAERLARAVGPDRAGGEGEQLLVVRAVRDVFTVSVDSSGELLHRRGYRQEVAKAPLRETLAAALLLALEWNGSVPLVDPFCGSGTIPIEAALLARDIAPGAGRGFGFERWPGHDAARFTALRNALAAAARPAVATIVRGSDRDAGAVRAARENAARAGVAADVSFREAALSSLEAPGSEGLLLTNPPYGVRVGDEAGLRDLFAALGRLARERLPHWTIAMLSANPALEAATGLRWVEHFRTSNGGIPVRLLTHRAG
jgi:putative N6-adenine-specific DNA methylase